MISAFICSRVCSSTSFLRSSSISPRMRCSISSLRRAFISASALTALAACFLAAASAAARACAIAAASASARLRASASALASFSARTRASASLRCSSSSLAFCSTVSFCCCAAAAALRAASSRICLSSSALARSLASLARCACSIAWCSASTRERASASSLARDSASVFAFTRAASPACCVAFFAASAFSCWRTSSLMSLAAPATTRCVEAGILPGAVKSKSSSAANGSASSLRVWKTRAKPSFVSALSALVSEGASMSTFSWIWPKLDLPSISLRTFIRSLEREADFWLTCVMPFAVLV